MEVINSWATGSQRTPCFAINVLFCLETVEVGRDDGHAELGRVDVHRRLARKASYGEAGRLLAAIVELGEPMNPLRACQLYTDATNRPSVLDPEHMPREGAM